MKKILYANGDSMTYGMEILGDKNRQEENKDYAYPAELSKLLGIETTINAAYCGAPNEFIFRKTIVDLLELEKMGHDPQDIFVVIGWSSICRGEIYLKEIVDKLFKEKNSTKHDTFEMPELDDFGTGFLNPGFQQGIWFNDGTKKNLFDEVMPLFVDFIWQDPLEFEKWFSQQIALENFLRNRGYDFLFFNAVHIFSELYSSEQTQILLDNFKSDNYYSPLTFSFTQWANLNYPGEKRELHHYSSVVHAAFADLLYNYITGCKLIT
jgi:hypothetical protein